MHKSFSLIGLSILIVSCGLPAVAQAPGLTITGSGRSANGKPLFDLKAENADVIEVLKQLFSRARLGAYEISPEIRQSVTFSAKGATADELIDKVRNSTTPPLNIVTNGQTVFVTRSANAVSRAEEIRRRMEGNPYSRLTPGIVPSGLSEAFAGGYRDAAALETPVSLNVPDDKPISLGALAALLEKQTRVPIRLDAGVPSDVKFTGVLTRVPLRSVLQNLAPGTGEGSLKIVSSANQILIAPTDRFNLMYGASVIGSTLRCERCRASLFSTWSFCPNCGQATKRGLLQPNTPSTGAGAPRKNPLRPD
jgi:hypothetical protein